MASRAEKKDFSPRKTRKDTKKDRREAQKATKGTKEAQAKTGSFPCRACSSLVAYGAFCSCLLSFFVSFRVFRGENLLPSFKT
jgi:hypothetical protein